MGTGNGAHSTEASVGLRVVRVDDDRTEPEDWEAELARALEETTRALTKVCARTESLLASVINPNEPVVHMIPERDAEARARRTLKKYHKHRRRTT